MNSLEFTQIEYQILQIYMKHGAQPEFAYILAQISKPVASQDPIKSLDSLEDLTENNTIVAEGAKISGLRNSPIFVQGMKRELIKNKFK